MLGAEHGLAFLQILEGGGGDRVLVPVKLLNLIAGRQFNQAADELRAFEVLVVLQIEQDLVARHLLEVDIVFYRRSLHPQTLQLLLARFDFDADRSFQEGTNTGLRRNINSLVRHMEPHLHLPLRLERRLR